MIWLHRGQQWEDNIYRNCTIFVLAVVMLWACGTDETAEVQIPCQGKCDSLPASDLDGDGLSDHEEVLLGTLTDNPDSDNDGHSDLVEVGFVDSPFDSDSDGLIDALELDSDNDGIPDRDEDAILDSDCNGLPDLRDIGSGPASSCEILPGIGLGDFVALGDNFDTVADLFPGYENGQTPFEIRIFEGRVGITFGDANMSRELDGGDPVVSVSAGNGYPAAITNGFELGSSREAIETQMAPEHRAVIPWNALFPSGDLSFYYTGGITLAYDSDTSSLNEIIVHHIYPVIPDGVLDLDMGTMAMASKEIVCGNGRDSAPEGSSPSDILELFGAPDYSGTSTLEVSIADVKIRYYFYHYLGVAFVVVEEIDKGWLGTETPNELLSVIAFTPFSGITVEGLGIGDGQEAFDIAPFEFVKETKLEGYPTSSYKTESGRLFGLVLSDDNKVLGIALNLPEFD